MKQLTTLLLGCFLCVSWLGSSQSARPISELLQIKNQNTHLCVSSVFTQEEIQLLKDHYGWNNSQPVVNLRNSGGMNVYGVENQSEKYGKFDKFAPEGWTEIADSPITAPNFEGAGAVNEDGSMAYVVDNENNLYQLALLTGVYTLLGALVPPAGHSITGLEFHPLTGVLYAISTNAAATALLIIDLIAVTANLIGITGMVLGIAMAFTPGGDLFAFDIDNDALYKIALATAIATFVGFVGFNANFGQGMALSFAAGVILLAAFNNDTFRAELHILNIVTGLATLIGVINLGVLSQFGWIGNPDEGLGIADNGDRLFSLFPNPTANELFLKSEERIESISLFNMMGQQVLYQPIDAQTGTVNLSSLASGQYLCTATINGRVGMYQVVKQ